MTPAVLTVEEAAALLRISRSAAYSAVKAGELPGVRVGRTWRVPRHRLLALLEGGETNGNTGRAEEDSAQELGAGEDRQEGNPQWKR